MEKALTSNAIQHLKSIGCTHVVLHASEAGTRVYDELGFIRAGEMRLDLYPAPSAIALTSEKVPSAKNETELTVTTGR